MVDAATSVRRRVLGAAPMAAISASLIGAAALAVGARPAVIPMLYLAGVTPLLWRVDIASHRLPDRLVLPGYLAALLALLAGEFSLRVLAAGVGYLTFMVVLWIAGGLGLGDVKLAGVLGLALGMLSVEAALLGPVLGFLLGGLASIGLILAGKAGRRSRIPFGPFMLAGFWAAALGSRLAPWAVDAL